VETDNEKCESIREGIKHVANNDPSLNLASSQWGEFQVSQNDPKQESTNWQLESKIQESPINNKQKIRGQ
jgi:hypothetical protein